MLKFTPYQILAFIYLSLLSCSSQHTLHEKINGVSFVASKDSINDFHIQPVLTLGANYAAVMPFGFLKNLSNPNIIHDTERQWFGERLDGVQQSIEKLKGNGIAVMIKPQIWIGHGEFTGHLRMDTDNNWKKLEESYTRFIIVYAKLAQKTGTEIMCIGTELENFIKERPTYWTNLIDQIKTVYNGKLTYAANWDEYKRVPFWEQLDYIGIDAYFPINDAQTPTVEDCVNGWQVYKETIHSLSNNMGKPILFTEFGYRNVDFAAKQPWKSDRDITTKNFEAQNNATKALFDVFWDEEWFAGGFLWKWFHNHDEVGGRDNNQFTPQNKPVEKIIRSYFTREK